MHVPARRAAEAVFLRTTRESPRIMNLRALAQMTWYTPEDGRICADHRRFMLRASRLQASRVDSLTDGSVVAILAQFPGPCHLVEVEDVARIDL